MKKHYLFISSMSLFLLIMLSGAYVIDNRQVAIQEQAVEVNWMSFEDALDKSKTEKRKIFIDVYTDWCGWCKVMDKKTFRETTIASYLNEHYYAVKFDAEQKEEITFRDKIFKFIPSGRRGYHELAAALLQNKLSYPTVVFLDEDFNLIQPLPGYRDAKAFHPILQFFGEDQYKNMKWDEFQKVYESPYN